MKFLVACILASAATEMWQDDTLNRYAAKTGEHELNLKFHYTNALWRRLEWLNCDTDVVKYGFHRRRPDAILYTPDGAHLEPGAKSLSYCLAA